MNKELKEKAMCEIETEKEFSDFRKMVDRMLQLWPQGEDYQKTKSILCQEFIDTVSKMRGTELAPYLADIKCVRDESCFGITFKIPLVSYRRLMHLE